MASLGLPRKIGPTAERLANGENAVPHAGVAELADARGQPRGGSSPLTGTTSD